MDLLDKKFNDFKIVGVIGHPIKHSYSPMMHNHSFDKLGMDYVYLPFDVPTENIEDAIKGAIALNFKGFNVTFPHKERMVEYCDELSEEASVIGAVNTVVNESGTLTGYNTDVNGVIKTLDTVKDEIAGETVSVIGSGGAARSVIYSLIRHYSPEKINIINRTKQKAISLREYFSSKMLFKNLKTYELIPPDIISVLKNSKLIVNTTSIGLFPETDDTPTQNDESFHPGQIVFDVIYNPVKTELLKLAESKGAQILSGLTMFVEQGAKSFEYWTNKEMPREEVYSLLLEKLLSESD